MNKPDLLLKALDDLNKSAQLNKYSSEIFVSKGLVYAKIGDVEEACSNFKIAKKMGSDEAKKWLKHNCK